MGPHHSIYITFFTRKAVDPRPSVRLKNGPKKALDLAIDSFRMCFLHGFCLDLQFPPVTWDPMILRELLISQQMSTAKLKCFFQCWNFRWVVGPALTPIFLFTKEFSSHLLTTRILPNRHGSVTNGWISNHSSPFKVPTNHFPLNHGKKSSPTRLGTPKPWKIQALGPRIWVVTLKNEGFWFPWHPLFIKNRGVPVFSATGKTVNGWMDVFLEVMKKCCELLHGVKFGHWENSWRWKICNC